MMLFVQTWLPCFPPVCFVLIHKTKSVSRLLCTPHRSTPLSTSSSSRLLFHEILIALWAKAAPSPVFSEAQMSGTVCLSAIRVALIFIWNLENRHTWFSFAKFILIDLSSLFFSRWRRRHELIFVFAVCAPLKFSLMCKVLVKRSWGRGVSVCWYDETNLCCFLSGSTCVTKCRGWDQIHWADGDKWPFDGKLLTSYSINVCC